MEPGRRLLELDSRAAVAQHTADARPVRLRSGRRRSDGRDGGIALGALAEEIDLSFVIGSSTAIAVSRSSLSMVAIDLDSVNLEFTVRRYKRLSLKEFLVRGMFS